MKRCKKCGVEANWSSADCPICFGQLESSSPSEAAAGSGRDWYAEYKMADRCIMVIHTMIDHAFSADDECPGDHVVERLYNLIAAIHPEGALPNPLSEYMDEAYGQNESSDGAAGCGPNSP